jgi:hypothetical protein
VQARGVQGLVGVDVAQPGDAGLVEQGGLERAPPAGREAGGEHIRREPGRERVRSVALLGDERVRRPVREEAQPGETALVVDVERAGRPEAQHEAGGGPREGGVRQGIGVAADEAGRVGRGEDQLPGDLQVQHEGEVAVQAEQEQLGAAVERLHGAPVDGAGGEPFLRAPQLGVEHGEALDRPATNQRCEAAAETLDFW